MSENQGNRFYSYTCPNCGADMEIVPNERAVVCQFCGKKLYFAEEQNVNQQNEIPSNTYANMASQVQESQSRINRGIKTVRKTVLIVYVVIFALVFGCVATSIVVGIVNTRNNITSHTTTATEMDPFEDMKVELEGEAPYASISKIRNTTDRWIDYRADKAENLSNGDKITIKVEEKYGYVWTSDSYTYTVSGLDTLVLAPSEIEEADVKAIHEFCIDEITRSWSRDIGNCTDDYQITVTPYKLCVNVRKEESYFSGRNNVLSAYQVDFVIDGKSGTAYTYVQIPEPRYTSDGKFKAAYDSATVKGYMWMHEFGFTDSYTMTVDGYESVQKMMADMEEDDFALVE